MSIKAARINGLEVSVCGVGELPDFATQGITHVVSLWDGYEAENPEPRMRLNSIFPRAQVHFGFFNDAFVAGCGDFAPQSTTIQKILRFTAALAKGDYLLVHCAVGISRSTAITFATLCYHAGPSLEVECFRALKRIRPSDSPNPLIVEIADGILGRQGALIRAIKGEA